MVSSRNAEMKKKKAKPVTLPKPERFLPYIVARNGQMGARQFGHWIQE